MNRSYYSNTIKNFLEEDKHKILGEINQHYSNRHLELLQKNAWSSQIDILKEQLQGIEGAIYFEFTIPRMGKRVDNILIVNDAIFVIEFKIGSEYYDSYAIRQVIDYALDLRNFHEGSHNARLIPLLVATEAPRLMNELDKVEDFIEVAKCNKSTIKETLLACLKISGDDEINVVDWENSIYKPTPTIVEAAQALYKGHNVKEISRSDADAINLSETTDTLNQIIENTKVAQQKSICFVTGVPGAGKTLAGLNIANERMQKNEQEHAVFLSGNGPLVEVLREALTRDVVVEATQSGKKTTKADAKRKTSTFIQNIHHFRDEYLRDHQEPIEKVVVFDEAQRAWNKEQASAFMKQKKGKDDFLMSEPDFLVQVMDRHDGWCMIICLIGGGQEINKGEAGIEEWIHVLSEHYQDWKVYYSHLITDSPNYLRSDQLKKWLNSKAVSEESLHLAVSIRSFRSEKLSAFIYHLLELDEEVAKKLYQEVEDDFPIVLTRKIVEAKKWLKSKAKGNERIGIIASSGARRLRPYGIDVKNKLTASNWFLNEKEDVRSSFFLEDVATEFEIQGLEIDWTCIAWGANLHLNNGEWVYQNFKGTRWMNIKKKVNQEYLKNAYRVLLTRARQGMVIFIPQGEETDITRSASYYDETYHYLKSIGIKELERV